MIEVAALLKLDFQFETGGDMFFEGEQGKTVIKVGQYLVRKRDGRFVVIDEVNLDVADKSQAEQVTDADMVRCLQRALSRALEIAQSTHDVHNRTKGVRDLKSRIDEIINGEKVSGDFLERVKSL